MPVVLLNPESVIFEMLSAMKHELARVFEIDPAWVTVSLEETRRFFLVGAKKVVPTVRITPPSLDDPLTADLARQMAENPPDSRFFNLSKEEIEAEIGRLAVFFRNEIRARIEGLDA